MSNKWPNRFQIPYRDINPPTFNGYRGVNIISFQYNTTYNTMNTDWNLFDLSKITSAGFDHVRLAIDPAYWSFSQPLVSGAILKCISSGLKVICDMHPSTTWKQNIASGNASYTASSLAFFTDLANIINTNNLAATSVAIQIMNEPGNLTPNYWSFCNSAIGTIRAIASATTCIVHIVTYGEITDNTGFPIEYNNVYGSAHYYGDGYEGIWSHQYTDWISLGYSLVSGLAYPASAANSTAQIAAVYALSSGTVSSRISSSDPTAISNARISATGSIAAYQLTNYSKANITQYFDWLDRWQNFTKRKVYITEIGCCITQINDNNTGSLQWFTDFRSLANARGYPYSLFAWGTGGGNFSVCDSSQFIKSTVGNINDV